MGHLKYHLLSIYAVFGPNLLSKRFSELPVFAYFTSSSSSHEVYVALQYKS
jgi:hypothetical protein